MKRIILTLVLSFLSFGANADPIVSWGWDGQVAPNGSMLVSGQVSNTPPGSDFTTIAGGQFHSLALDASGTIHSWGSDIDGQVSNTPTGTGFTAIAAGDSHSLALDASGTIHIWGRDDYGQFSNTPPGTGFTAIVGGGQISHALDASGTIHCWGFSSFIFGGAGGIVGKDCTTPPGSGFTAIAGRGDHSHALDASGTIHSWGAGNQHGTTNPPPGTGFTAIAAGGNHGLALDASGTIHAWGYDSSGQVSYTPHGTGFTAIASGYAHRLALLGSAAAINIYNSVLHPHHDGSGSNPDDVIPVIVYGSSTLVGDLADLDTDDIDVSTLRFGPGMGSISPTGQSWFNFDLDSDGLDDAIFQFQMSDAAFDKVTCSDVTGTLVGELTGGETFTGIDSFISNCNASCH